jgi:hypothetical protein
MAKIPTTIGQLDTPRAGRAVASYDTSSVRSGLLGAAAATGKGLNDLADGFQSLAVAAEKVEAEDDRRYAVELENEFAKRIASIQYGDGTANNPGYFNLQGEQAVSGYAGTEQSIERAKQDLLQKAKNRRVKETFKLAADRRQVTETEQMRSHVGKARVDAANTASETRFTQAAEDAAASPLNPEILNRSFAIVENEAIAWGKRNGFNNETIALKISDARTSVLGNVVNGLVTSDPQAADDIYQANKHRISASGRAKIENVLAPQVLAVQAQTIAEEAAAQFPGNEAAQKAWIRENFEGKKEDVAIGENDKRWAEYKGRVQWNDYLKDQTWQAWSRGRALEAAEREDTARAATQSLATWMRQNPGKPRTLWEAKNAAEADIINADRNMSVAFDAYELRLAEGEDYVPVSDKETKDAFFTMPWNEMAKLDEEYVTSVADLYLNRKDSDKLMTYYRSSVNRMEGVRENNAIYEEMEGIIRAFTPYDRASGKKKYTEDGAQFTQVINDANVFIDTYKSKGKVPSRADMTKEVQRLWMGLVADPENDPMTWLGIGGSEWEGIVAQQRDLTPEQRAVARVPLKSIPSDRLDGYRKAAQKNGIAEPDDALLEELAAADALGDFTRWNKLLGKK